MSEFVDALGEEYYPKKFLTYDDVILLPQYSEFNSRFDAILAQHWGEYKLDIPFISANMDTITGPDMAIEMDSIGGLGILHRFWESDEEYRRQIGHVARYTSGAVAFSVGLNGNQPSEWIADACSTIETCSGRKRDIIVCLDVAHADSKRAYNRIEELRQFEDIYLIAGNVATPEAALRYARLGVDAIKVGIGCGAVCQTRVVAGHGVPQFSAIYNISNYLKIHAEREIKIIADGGIRTSGDIAKAIGAGAHAVMIGSLFAGCSETPGEISDDGTKIYRGQSSRTFMNAVGKDLRTSEGISSIVEAKGSVYNIIDDLAGGLRSAMSYTGNCTLSGFRNNAKFIEISQAGIVEGQTHMLHRDGVTYDGE